MKRAMPETSKTPLPLSDVLREISEHDGPHISVADMSARFGGRALGALLLIFGLLCMLPLPPGGTTIFGLPLLFLAPQLVIGKRAPWLPGKVSRQKVSTGDLRAGLPRVIPWLQKVEAVSRPRLSFLFGPVGERLIGLVCTVLAFVLILPIPLGNILPATAVTVLSLSLIQRDGVIALLGYAIAGASAGVLALAAHVVVRALQSLWSVFGAA